MPGDGMKFWLLTAFLVGVELCIVWGIKYGYTPSSKEIEYVVTDAEFHRLRAKHCGLKAGCCVSEGYFIDDKGRRGKFK
jgi:hypothetical protein